MSYQSLILAARPELQRILGTLDPDDRNTQDLMRVLQGIDYELSKAARVSIERLSVEPNQDGWGRDRPGVCLCSNPNGNLVFYADHLVTLAAAKEAQ